MGSRPDRLPRFAAPLAVARALFQAGTSARFLDTPDALLAPGFARLIAAERDCQQRVATQPGQRRRQARDSGRAGQECARHGRLARDAR